ncbi:MAG: YgiQ family radical SAM protein [Candidatus Thermoplasmatota archaeon]
MISKTGHDFDVILVSGEYYDDHPLSPVGILARVLDAKNYRVGIIEKPETKEDFTCLGSPRLCFCVSSGSIDSMLHNYTPLKRRRADTGYKQITKLPDRAVIYYCNKIKEYFKSTTLVIGGIEASLRRFAHYDYWDNALRRSILLDSRANILVYGNGEKQLLDIVHRLANTTDLIGIPGTCILSRTIDDSMELLPSYTQVCTDPVEFCRMQQAFSNDKNLAQEYTNSYVVQYRYPTYTFKDLDWIYSLPYTRKLHPQSPLKMAQFSVVTHRGCIGFCHFCSLALHQGERIISRSEQNILEEITRLTEHPQFKGYIDDLGGPSANMYGMDCTSRDHCLHHCIDCQKLDRSHLKLINLLRKVRMIPGVKKVFVRSGIRYDLALYNLRYIEELSKYHISGCLKIAPEHFSPKVTALMHKDNTRFSEFLDFFTKINAEKKQFLTYYFMIGHPGETLEDTRYLREMIRKMKLRNVEQFQLFTPTPMTISTCMYWTKLNPFTFEPVDVVCDYATKKKMKRILLGEPVFATRSSKSRKQQMAK